MLIIGLVIEFAVSALCVIMGSLIWLKKKVSLINDYQHRHVKRADIPAYCRLVGIGLILIGIGILITGLFNLLEISLWWLPLIIGFAAGIVVLNKAQKKYNGSWLS